MIRDYTRFGGVLLLFLTICWFNLVMLALNTFTYLRDLIYNGIDARNKAVLMVLIIEELILAYIFVKFILAIRRREPEVPILIQKSFTIVLLLGIGYLIINLPVIWWANNTLPEWSAPVLKSSIGLIMGSLVWKAYFKNSKRVKAYYLLTEEM